jgi:hypothetical protein
VGAESRLVTGQLWESSEVIPRLTHMLWMNLRLNGLFWRASWLIRPSSSTFSVIYLDSTTLSGGAQQAGAGRSCRAGLVGAGCTGCRAGVWRSAARPGPCRGRRVEGGPGWVWLPAARPGPCRGRGLDGRRRRCPAQEARHQSRPSLRRVTGRDSPVGRLCRGPARQDRDPSVRSGAALSHLVERKHHRSSRDRSAPDLRGRRSR